MSKTLLSRLQRLLAPPRFADPETDRVARSAYTCAVVFMSILAVWMPVAYRYQGRSLEVLGVGFAVMTALFAVAGFARAGWPRLAAGLLVALLYGAATFGLWSEGGLRGTSMGAFFALVVAASLFFSLRAAWATAALSVVTLVGFWRLELAGLLPPLQTFGSERVLISNFTAMAVVVALVQLSLGRIRESQRFLREITDATPHGLYVYDVIEGQIAYSNAASRDQLDYTPENSRQFSRAIHPDDREPLVRHGDRIVAAGDHEILVFEYRARHRDGTWRTIRDRARVFDRTPDGRVRQIMGVAEDLTAEREAQEALERSRERLRRGERLEALGQLAGGIAHDFNNYLTVIIGSTEAASRMLGERDGELRELIGDAHEAGKRSGELTRQLLGFSRHRLMQPRTFDLNHLLRESDRLLSRVLPANIELDVSPGEGVAFIHADPGQIEQVVLNLVVNARDAMPDGGRLSIRTKGVVLDGDYVLAHPDAQEGSHVKLSVADTGTGMDEATRAQIFEPLFTTKGSSGTGFGLATVEAVVRQSGGHVQVESELGAGTRFDVFLPCSEQEPDRVEGRAERAAAQGGERILVVEDDPLVRNFTRRALAECGYRVTDVEDGAEGRRVFLESPDAYDVVLTDIMLPGLSGLELAASLREARPDLPIVFMSGYTANALAQKGLEPKEHLLHKPFTLEALQGQLREALDEA